MNPVWAKFISSITQTLFNEFQKNSNQNKKAHTSSDIAIAVDLGSSQIGFAQDKITKISAKGIDLICGFEGMALQAYDDGVGVCTIGFGTTIYPSGQPVQYGDQCTLEQAKQFMHHDLKRFEQAVNSAVKVPIYQNQFDALVSLTYNIGIGAFQNSTLLTLLNDSDYVGASNQFDVWIKAGGQTVQGLVNRRAAEKKLFLNY